MSEPGGPRNHPPISGENGNPMDYDYDPPTANFPLSDVNNPPSFLSGEQNPDHWDPRSGEKPTRKQLKELTARVDNARAELRDADNPWYFDRNIEAVDTQVDYHTLDGSAKSGYLFRFGNDPSTKRGSVDPYAAAHRFKHAEDEEGRNDVVNSVISESETHDGLYIYDDEERAELAAKVRGVLGNLGEMVDDPTRFAATMYAMNHYRDAKQLEEAAREARGGNFKDKVTARLNNRFAKALMYLPKKGAELVGRHPKSAIAVGVVAAGASAVFMYDLDDVAVNAFNDIMDPSEVAGQPVASMDAGSGQLPQPEDRGATSPSQAPQPEATGVGAVDTLQESAVPPDEIEPNGSGGAAGQEEEPAAQTPPVEPLEITDEHREVTSGMGWNEKFKQLGVNPEYNDELLKQLGPDLEERGLAYWSEDAKEWRMKSLEDGISDEDLQWIHEQAASNGFLAEQAPAPAPAAEPEPSAIQPDGSIETAELGKYSGELNPETGYLEGTGYNAVASALEDQAEMLGIKGVDFTQLQQQPGFNSAYHEFVGEVLQQNGLDWDSARSMNGSDRLTIPPETLQKFLTEQGIFTPPDTLANTDLLDLSPGSATPAAVETASLGNLPPYSEIQASDTYETVFERVFENDPQVPAEMRGDPQVQREFLNNLVSDRDQLSDLYAGVPVNALSTSWNSFLSETIFIPQVEQNGTWYIHPKFIENALALMQTFLNPTVETGAGA